MIAPLRRLALASLFVIAASAAVAYAQPADPAALEASGQRHYELAEYAAAIADFKEAFRITDQPELLFNIAQAYRLAGDCKQALTFYRTYLRRLPGAGNAEKVKARIAEMEACAAKATAKTGTEVGVGTELGAGTSTSAGASTRTSTGTSAGTSTGTSTSAGTSTSGPRRTRRGWKTWAGVGALGAGALALGAGGLFAVRGASKRDALRDLCEVSCDGAEAKDVEAAGRAANRNATIGFIAGGALVAAGVVLILVDRPRADERTGPAVGVGAGGATATWTWSF